MSRLDLRILVLAGFLLVTAVVVLTVEGHEQTLAEGRIVLAELAPVDPRSLMQGDYMALRFAIDDQLRGSDAPVETPARPRFAVLQLDGDQRATLVGLSDQLPEPGTGRVAMRLRRTGGAPGIGPNAFFFQEGTAERFEAAKWGEFRVAADGKALLTHLRDERLERIGGIDR